MSVQAGIWNFDGKPVDHTLLGEFSEALVQISRVRVEFPHLRDAALYDFRVAMPDVRHVVDAIEIFSSFGVVEVSTRAPHDVQGFTVGDAQRRADEPLTRGKELLGLILCASHARAALKRFSAAEGGTSLSRSSSAQAGASLIVW